MTTTFQVAKPAFAPPGALLVAARRQRTLRLALAACLLPVGLLPAGLLHAADPIVVAAGAAPPGASGNTVTLAGAERGLYLVEFADPPVARRELPAVSRNGAPRADMRSAQARAMADEIGAAQFAVLAEVSTRTGRQLRALQSYRYAFNGVVVALGAEERKALKDNAAVRRLEPVRAMPLQGDTGPAFIGATRIWDGSATGGLPGTQGEGTVVGIIDTGINWNSPSFADVGADGHDHASPLGGQYLGVCASARPAPDGPACNDKLIGAYAVSYPLVTQINAECALPDPSDGELGLEPWICEALGVPLQDSPVATDENGHGSHTAATAVGNVVNVDYLGNPLSLSGVAPHANLVVYDACYTNVHGGGSCFNASTLAAVEQAVQDGVVDVLNYSIAGGAQPWQEPTSQAFLTAVDAGIFVAAAAGNSGPGAETVAHLEPWTMSVAASTHGREFAPLYSVTAPSPVPAELVDQALFPGTAGAPFAEAIAPTTPLVVSPGFGSADDACEDFGDPSLFAGAVALLSRGTCAFTSKVLHAQWAGAVAVLVANNQPGLLRMGGEAIASIPAFGITQAQGEALREFAAANSGVTVGIPLDLKPVPVPADTIAGFSSRGPAWFPVLKPEIAAPGANILSAVAGGPDAYALLSGTSMASPHIAGAAALLRDLRPDWSVPELKSALMLTAASASMTLDGGGAAGTLDRGAGRVDLTRAARPGLVMHETPLRMMLADPATGGRPETLNLASLQSDACAEQCSWSRSFRNVEAQQLEYTVSFRTDSAMTVQTRPSTLVVPAGGTLKVDIQADVTALPTGSWWTGDLVLQPSDATLPTLSLPVAVKSIDPVPELVLSPSPLVVSVRSGGAPVTVPLTVANTGVRDLSFQRETDGHARGVALYSQLRDPDVAYGTPSGFYAGMGGQGTWMADAFVLPEGGTIGGIFADGFFFQLDASFAYSHVDMYVFPDAFGAPAGDPGTSPEAAVWSHTAALGAPGLTVNAGEYGGSIQLDLPAAAQSLQLPAGKYWLVLATHNLGMPGDGAEWYWMGTGASANRHDRALVADPDNLRGIGGGWQEAAPVIDQDFTGMSFEVQGTVPCASPWLRTSGDGGIVTPGSQDSVEVQVDPDGLEPGRHQGALCFSTNDPARPWASVPVVMDVTGTTTSPTGVATVEPVQAAPGQSVLLRVAVTPGTWPDSTGLRVDANLEEIGGSAAQRLYDDGSNGDDVAGDNRFATRMAVGAGTASGDKVLRATIRDNEGRMRRASVTLHVVGGGEVLFGDGFE